MDPIDDGWDEIPMAQRPHAAPPPSARPTRADWTAAPRPTTASRTPPIPPTPFRAPAAPRPVRADTPVPPSGVRAVTSSLPQAVATTVSAELAEVLEEVDFFICQGLVRDARTLLLEQLLRAPRHPAIVSRLARIAAARTDRTNAG